MSHSASLAKGRTWLTALAAAAILAGAATAARAQDDGAIEVSGEIDFTANWYRTNVDDSVDGTPHANFRGDDTWPAFFGNGLEDSYSGSEMVLREAELKFKKTSAMGGNWEIDYETELEIKGDDDFDLEEASATFKHTGGFYTALGVLEDKGLYEMGFIAETISEDAKGFDEVPSVRFGYVTGPMDVDVRYHSSSSEVATGVDTDGDGNADDKRVFEQHLRLQAEYEQGPLGALATYSQVTNENVEGSGYQDAETANEGGTLSDADFATFDKQGLDSKTVLGLGVIYEIGDIVPMVTWENYDVEEDDGDGNEYTTQIVTVGVTLNRLGPGNLVLTDEIGSSDIADVDGDGKNDTVNANVFHAEYHWSAGGSRFGPGLKIASNDAEEKVEHQLVYFGGEWAF